MKPDIKRPTPSAPKNEDAGGNSGLAEDILRQYKAGDIDGGELTNRINQLPPDQRKKMSALIRRKLRYGSSYEDDVSGVAGEIEEMTREEKRKFWEMMKNAPLPSEKKEKPVGALERMKPYLRHIIIIPLSPFAFSLTYIVGLPPEAKKRGGALCKKTIYFLNKQNAPLEIASSQDDPGVLLELIESGQAVDMGEFSAFNESTARLIAKSYHRQKHPTEE